MFFSLNPAIHGYIWLSLFLTSGAVLYPFLPFSWHWHFGIVQTSCFCGFQFGFVWMFLSNQFQGEPCGQKYPKGDVCVLHTAPQAPFSTILKFTQYFYLYINSVLKSFGYVISLNWDTILNSWDYSNYRPSCLNGSVVMIATFLKGHSEGGSLIVGHESCLFSAFTGDILIALVRKWDIRPRFVICILNPIEGRVALCHQNRGSYPGLNRETPNGMR